MSKLRGLRVLIVEDEFLVAESLIDLLEQAGAIVVGPIGWANEALDFIQKDGAYLDAAVLDVNLHGQPSYRVAEALKTRGIKFVFITGYDMAALDPAFRDHPRCEKPLQPQAILAALSAAQR